jgi:hypothetical protein
MDWLHWVSESPVVGEVVYQQLTHMLPKSTKQDFGEKKQNYTILFYH